MKYRGKYKYQLAKDEQFQTSFRPLVDIYTTRILLNAKGLLTILEGYAWDGISGPVIDRDTNMHGGLKHDALYELMRKGLLDHALWRQADCEFAKELEKHGAWQITIKIDMAGLKISGGKYAHPDQRKKVYTVHDKETLGE
jgi:hypothetical protein